MKGRGIPAAVASAGLIALVAIGAHGAPAGKKDEGPFKRGLVGRRAYRLYVPPRSPTESAGAFMAVNLLCAAPELISGVGVVAGGAYRCGLGPDGALACMRGHRLDGDAAATACLAAAGKSVLAIRASLWQGDQDSIVTPANLPALETMFARLVGGASKTIETRDGSAHARYKNQRGDLVIESWLVPGLGHAWSGGDPRATHTWPPGPSATARILDFLLERS